jgi:hypothetical protein
MIGLDPDDILLTPTPLVATPTPTEVMLARCSCGIVGCDSREVTILRDADDVIWRFAVDRPTPDECTLRFAASAYDAEIARAQTDTSWETPDRRAARLLRSLVPDDQLAAHGLRFQWSSGRLRPRRFSVSLELSPGPYQIILHLPWQRETPEQIAARAAKTLATPPQTWRDVSWHPQRTQRTQRFFF